MPALKSLFEDYGADYSSAMERFLGNEALYLKCLKMLFRDDSLDRLGAALERDDLEGAFAAAHTLKGVTGNMGLTPYYQAVCAVVEPLRAGETGADYAALYRAIREEYERVRAMWLQVGAEA